MWTEQRERLRNHLEALTHHRPAEYVARHRRSLGFDWIAPTENAAAANLWLDEKVARAHGAEIVLGADGVVTSVRRVGAGTESFVETSLAAVLDQVDVGRMAPPELLGADGAEERTRQLPDRDHLELPVAPLEGRKAWSRFCGRRSETTMVS